MLGAIVRFVVSALALMFVAWITPGVAVGGFWGALFASLVIAGLGWVAQALLGRGASPASRGLTGFVAAAIIIYLTGWLFPGWLTVTWWGAALAAFVIGLVDAVVPTELR
ncbi:MAG TPA: phage holin family protein [Symbiobacteriaceae bacterium]|nr:phage holin family protein [Symbiobacteriaceae bacterium]